jgi:hypothetical protein
VKHIDNLEDLLQDSNWGHIVALVLTRVAREQCPIKLIQDFSDIKHAILKSTSQTLKFSHGIMLLAAISSQPNASDEMKYETIGVMLDLLDEPKKASKYNPIIFAQMVVLARDDYQILTPYQAKIANYKEVPKGMIDFMQGKEEPPELRALLDKIEQQIATLADKVGKLKSLVN